MGRHGKDGVAAFFEAFGSTMEVQEFNPFAFAANETELHTVGSLSGHVSPYRQEHRP